MPFRPFTAASCPDVADAVQALFLNAYRPGVHMALEGQFSEGLPGRCVRRQRAEP